MRWPVVGLVGQVPEKKMLRRGSREVRGRGVCGVLWAWTQSVWVFVVMLVPGRVHPPQRTPAGALSTISWTAWCPVAVGLVFSLAQACVMSSCTGWPW